MKKQENCQISDAELGKVRWVRRLAVGLPLAAVPLALLLFRVSQVVRLPLFFLLVPYALVCLSAVLCFVLVPCPRCKKRFFAGAWGVNPLANRCRNCGLGLHEDQL